MNTQQTQAPTEPKSTRRKRPVPAALVRREGAAAMCGMGLSTFDRADAAGLVPAGRRVGGCKLWSVAELKAWAARGCPNRSEWSALWQALLSARRGGRVK